MQFLRHISILVFALMTITAQASGPTWFESDSMDAIYNRIRSDFPMSVDEFYKVAIESSPGLTREQYDDYVTKKYIETLEVDGEIRVHRKALRNMRLLNPATNDGWTHRGYNASVQDIGYVDSVLGAYSGANAYGGARRVVYRFSIDIPGHEAIQGDTVRVWMPLPMQSNRQNNIRILSTSHTNYILSDGRSLHNSIYFEAPAAPVGNCNHFEYTATFDTRGEYFAPADIMASLKPYDTDSEFYKTYTAFESPHIIRLDSLAQAIASGETNPFLLSEKVYDYILHKYPWAGAREYSTISCMPEYVIKQGHGDCGQVALLYISLMRTLGIPARWESGWVLNPGEKGMHDWAEVYFEGVGWVPVDVSAGRFTTSDNPEVVNFYSHGTDAYRFATNLGVCDDFYPRKRFVRSETVDAQLGEVETSKGNLFYPAWDSDLEIISITPITFDELRNGEASHALVSVSVATMRAKAAHSSECITQAVMGTPLLILDRKDEWLQVESPEGYVSWIPESSIQELSNDEFTEWRANKERNVVSEVMQIQAFTTSTSKGPRDIVSDLVLGSIVETGRSENGRTLITMPDKRQAWVESTSLTPIGIWASQKFDAEKILSTAYSLMGTPYLWGGASTKSMDCSGLVKVCYLNNGIILLRDASQQAQIGQWLECNPEVLKPGDLLFFASSTSGKIIHVAIYDANEIFIHSSGMVRCSNLDTTSPDYDGRSPVHAVRIDGHIGSEGIILAKDHPWYFNLSNK